MLFRSCGTVDDLLASPRSLTGQFLSGQRRIPLPPARRAVNRGRVLVIRGAAEHNKKR